MELHVRWLGRVPYRRAWQLQHELVDARAADEVSDQLLLVEHDPVLTLGRGANASFIRASNEDLAARGIEVIGVERGGEVTYHGPGQLVAYPIVKLADRGLLVRPFVRALEEAMTRTLATYGVAGGRREGYPGCWCDPDTGRPRKLGALGLRVERGVTYHGIALNVTTRLEDFELIDPCGLPGSEVSSIAREAGWSESEPSTMSVALAGQAFAREFQVVLDELAAGTVEARRPASSTGEQAGVAGG